MYWHVPAWYESRIPGANGDASAFTNVGRDILIPLINTDFAAPGDPRQDNFVVERIIGQWQLVSKATALAGDALMHHRVYVADSDSTTVSVRDIYMRDDADSSFLYHHVSGWPNAAVGTGFGSWRLGGSAEPQSPVMMGRQGHVDIKVGRRVEEGQTLLWHTQVSSSAFAPVDDDWELHAWFRVLMREG